MVTITGTPAVGGNAATTSASWKGMTLDELKMRRAKSLIKREVGRMDLMREVQQARSNVQENGVRGMLFSNSQIAGLKKADYAFLSYKLVKMLVKLYARRRRR